MSKKLKAGNLLLGVLPSEARQRAGLQEQTLPIREVLIRAEEVPRFVFFPCDRAVASIIRPTRDGQQVEAGVVGREGVVSAQALLAPLAPTGCHAVVQNDGCFVRVELTMVRQLFEEQPPFRDALLAYVSVFLDQVTQNLVCNRLHPIERRLAKWLLMMQDRVASDELHLTQDFLASMLGVHRPGVTLAVRALEDDGLIAHRRNWLEIRDREGVLTRSCECYPPLNDRFVSFAAHLSREARAVD
jgi:CRP-like cAMP-binding protein